MGNYRFDLDLQEGKGAERFLRDLLTGDLGTVEVKRDFMVSTSGKIAVEYSSRGKKSGLAVTQALWWATVLDGPRYGHEVVVLMKTERMKALARVHFAKGGVKPGGDPDPKTGKKTSMNVLIPVGDLVLWTPSQVQPALI